MSLFRICAMTLGALAGVFGLTLGSAPIEAAPKVAAITLNSTASTQRGCEDCGVLVTVAEQDRAPVFPFGRTFRLDKIDGGSIGFYIGLEVERRADGRLRARGGWNCNELYGEVVLGDNGRIKLDLASTMKECSVSTSQSEEDRISEAFEKVDRWRLESDVLILEGGGHVIRMMRTGVKADDGGTQPR
jgi:heat shock protein HslJ